MTKSIILLIAAAAILALVAPGARAQLTAAGAFASAPQGVFPLLDKNTRLDMIDYYNSHLDTPSQNALQGRSRITGLNDKQLSVELTPSSQADIFILPRAAGDSIIGLISTVATPTPDASVAFYDAKWAPLDASKIFKRPGLADWLTPEGRANREMVEGMLPFLLVGYAWNPADNSLTLTNNSAKFLSDDIYSMVAPYMLPQLVYVWDGRKFSPAQ